MSVTEPQVTDEATPKAPPSAPASAVTPDEAFRKAQKRRSIALALALTAFVVLVFVITVVRLQEQVLDRPL